MIFLCLQRKKNKNKKILFWGEKRDFGGSNFFESKDQHILNAKKEFCHTVGEESDGQYWDEVYNMSTGYIWSIEFAC